MIAPPSVLRTVQGAGSSGRREAARLRLGIAGDTVQRTSAVVERCGEGWPSRPLALEVSPHESLFTAVSDPLEAPEVFQLRNAILSWRFYDSFRIDRQASARSGRIATRTPSLAGGGGDLAAAVQTHPSVGGGPRRGSDHGSGGHPRLPAAAIGAGAWGHGAARPDGAGAGRLALAGVKDDADIPADIPTVGTSPLTLHRWHFTASAAVTDL